jgi:hypothetical protein
MNVEDEPPIMVVARGAVYWGYAVERRGKREAWLLRSPTGGFRYASIHAALYHYTPEAFAKLSALFGSKDNSDDTFQSDWEAIVASLKAFTG